MGWHCHRGCATLRTTSPDGTSLGKENSDCRNALQKLNAVQCRCPSRLWGFEDPSLHLSQ